MLVFDCSCPAGSCALLDTGAPCPHHPRGSPTFLSATEAYEFLETEAKKKIEAGDLPIAVAPITQRLWSRLDALEERQWSRVLGADKKLRIWFAATFERVVAEVGDDPVFAAPTPSERILAGFDSKNGSATEREQRLAEILRIRSPQLGGNTIAEFLLSQAMLWGRHFGVLTADFERLDLAQAALVKTYRASPFRSMGQLIGTAVLATKHLAIDEQRRQQCRVRTTPLLEGSGVFGVAMSPPQGVEAARRTGPVVPITAGQKRVLMLRYFESCSWEELATRLGVARSTARGRHDTALEQLMAAEREVAENTVIALAAEWRRRYARRHPEGPPESGILGALGPKG